MGLLLSDILLALHFGDPFHNTAGIMSKLPVTWELSGNVWSAALSQAKMN
jgi:hypothetical protein